MSTNANKMPTIMATSSRPSGSWALAFLQWGRSNCVHNRMHISNYIIFILWKKNQLEGLVVKCFVTIHQMIFFNIVS